MRDALESHEPIEILHAKVRHDQPWRPPYFFQCLCFHILFGPEGKASPECRLVLRMVPR